MTFLAYRIGAIMVANFGIIKKKKKHVLRALEMVILSYPVYEWPVYLKDS